MLDDPVIVEIAEHHGRAPGQIVIRWHLQLGNVVIPKSVTPERIRQNIDVFDFQLSDQQMERNRRAGPGKAHRPGPRHVHSPLRPAASSRPAAATGVKDFA